MKQNRRFWNQLAVIRRRTLTLQKQVSKLLERRSTEDISRWEGGTKLPSLATALKLAVMYDIPARDILDGYFNMCRTAIKQQESRMGKKLNGSTEYNSLKIEFCSYEELMKKGSVTGEDLDSVRRHAVQLINRRAEKLDHRSV